MNERIELISDTKVRVRRLQDGCATHPDTFVTEIHSNGGLLGIKNSPREWSNFDAEGRAALRDVINCLDATGSFAALADTSAVPFVGKRMRLSEGFATLLAMCMHPNKWFARVVQIGVSGSETDFDSWINESELLPIDPEPKRTVVSWTPREAVKYLNASITSPDATSGPYIKGVFEDHILTSTGIKVSYDDLTKWRLYPSNQFCGGHGK